MLTNEPGPAPSNENSTAEPGAGYGTGLVVVAFFLLIAALTLNVSNGPRLPITICLVGCLAGLVGAIVVESSRIKKQGRR